MSKLFTFPPSLRAIKDASPLSFDAKSGEIVATPSAVGWLAPEKPRPKVEPASAFQYTQDQRNAKVAIEKFLASDERVFLLTGYAGTGKSTIMSRLIANYTGGNAQVKVALLATANKAVGVLRKMARDVRASGVDCMTCCKFLNLRPEIDDNGKQVFVVDRGSEGKVDPISYNLVLVDECSQINEEMWYLLQSELTSLLGGLKVIFCGDSAQLRPVGEESSLVFKLVPEQNRAHLTEVVRYDGAVGVTAELIRKTEDWGVRPSIQTGENEGKTKGVFQMSYDKLLSTAVRAFTSPEYTNSPDRAKVLCYTNREVAEINGLIHRARYGAEALPFVPGMFVVVNNPILQGKTVMFSTSDELKVLSVCRATSGKWKVWALEVRGADRDASISVLHPDSFSDFAKDLKVLSETRQWYKFWKLKQCFADVQHLYAQTVHKSQGSTYDDVFIPLSGILSCREVEVRQELAYVAFSRPRNRVFFST